MTVFFRTGYAYGIFFVSFLALVPCGRGRAEDNTTPRQHVLVEKQFIPPPHGAWCGDYRFNITEAQRLGGNNLERLQAAQAELAPGFAAGTSKTELYLLADYQAELGKRRPDTILAANYLALASAVPITPARYRQVNALLCVSAAAGQARAIQSMAETLRQQGNAAAAQ